jgi:hypothetical protein
LIENGAKIYNPDEDFGESKNLIHLAKITKSKNVYNYLASKAKDEGGVAAKFVDSEEKQ